MFTLWLSNAPHSFGVFGENGSFHSDKRSLCLRAVHLGLLTQTEGIMSTTET